jgi:hydrogenase expression/formation protein HypE
MTNSTRTDSVSFSPACPAPLPAGECVLLAHGEGAGLSRRLIREIVLAALDNDLLRPLGDGAVSPDLGGRIVFSADSYVVSPLFFPGGDIGKLAVHGTVNDLAVCGAEPLYLSLGLIIEEGLPLETLRRVIRSVADCARACGVSVVTGDTKVVPHGAADGLFLHTAGVGRLRQGVDLGAHRVRSGDRILVNGPVGDHGIAVLCAREGIDMGDGLRSDTAPLHGLVAALLDAKIDVHFMRDATRGGVSAVLHEVAEAAGVGVEIEEAAVPLSPAVRGACELLGLDPLYVANEGKLVVIVTAEDADRTLACLRGHAQGADAAIIGDIRDGEKGQVLIRGSLGGLRFLDEPAGAPLPRIC